MKPTKGNLIIKVIEEKSLIDLPEEAKLKPMMGVVIKSNSDSIFEASTVLFKKYAADEIEVEGQKYLVVREEDILVIL